MTCVLPVSVWNEIRAHVAAEDPREGCGLLVGRDLPGERRIQRSIPVSNGEPNPLRRYSIAPEVFLQAEKAARAQALEVVGFYHSHPGGDSTPSASDEAEAWPHYTYLIVGMPTPADRAMKAWRLEPGGFVSDPIRLESGRTAS
jgi:proteasome lid subunit RPN8/RPN11